MKIRSIRLKNRNNPIKPVKNMYVIETSKDAYRRGETYSKKKKD